MAEAGYVTVKDVMTTAPFSLDAESSLWDAWTFMTQADVRHVVVTANGRFVGIVDQVHLLSVWAADRWALTRRNLRYALPVRAFCVLPQCSVSETANVMCAEHIDAVAVVDQAGEFLGLVTTQDLLRVVSRTHRVGSADDAPSPRNRAVR